MKHQEIDEAMKRTPRQGAGRDWLVRPATRVLAIGILIGLAPHAGADETDVPTILRGVTEIAKPGVPGPIAVYGPDAFAIATGQGSGQVHHAVVAGARVVRGRVVAFGHGGYLTQGALDQKQTATLVLNAVRWAAGDAPTPRVAIWKQPALRTLLEAQGGFEVLVVGPDSWRQALKDADVLCLGARPGDDEALEQVRDSVRRGRGLIVAGLGWGWKQLHPGKTLRQDFWLNRLCAPFGLVWADGYLDSIDAAASPIALERLKDVHALRAVERLGAVGRSGGEARSPAEIRQHTAILGTLVHALPRDDRLIRPELERLARQASEGFVISAETPITLQMPWRRLAVTMRSIESEDTAPAAIEADPSAAVFPGAVPAEARRLRATIAIDLATPGWQGTGLYAAPGEPVRVSLPAEARGAGLTLQIGCHTDTLWSTPQWKRHPAITRRVRLDEPVTVAASPFGGLLYLDVPRDASGATVTIQVTGAVAAPRFVLGRTSLEDWRQTIRHQPAPWAEFETTKVVLTTQSAAIRDLDDPGTLLERWNQALDCYAQLGMRPLPARPARLVPDVQISAGYMHSGYPIMMHLDQVDRLVDVEHLGQAWGYWHELGHNHQQASWTFGGTGEVTCNLFTMFVIERLTGVPACEHERFVGQAANARAHLAGGAPFDTWKRRPFLALHMYMQLQEAFGWEAYQRVFAEYRDVPGSERPGDDQAKRDQWLVRFSRVVGRDLGPFFERWGVPTSPQARASLADLEPWLPESMR